MIAWPHYKTIEVSNGAVDADLADFPLLVALDGDADLGARAKPDGSDLRFTIDDGAPLDYEIEQFVVEGGAAALRAWVRVPELAANGPGAVAARLRCYYGNPAAADAQDPPAVWTPSGHVLVSHMTDGATTAHVAVSTGSTEGVKKGPGEPVEAAAPPGKAQQFDGADDYVTFGSDVPATESAYTISFRLYATARGGLFSRSVGGSWSAERLVVHQFNTDKLSVTHANGSVYHTVASAADLPRNQWVHAAVAWDGASLAFYFDGVHDVSRALAHATAHAGVKTWLGRVEGLSPNFTTGLIGEFRYAGVARSAAWLKFAHANMTGTFEQAWGEEKAAASAVALRVARRQLFLSGAAAGRGFLAGPAAGQTFLTGSLTGQAHD